jgi:hypothetical protein
VEETPMSQVDIGVFCFRSPEERKSTSAVRRSPGGAASAPSSA